MKIILLARATLFNVFGGDTVQIIATARYLRKLGIDADIKKVNEKIDFNNYDLIHVFNVIRPADTLYHVIKSGKPYVLSTIYVNFSEYEKNHRKGLLKLFVQIFNADQLEYIKVLMRYLKNNEKIQSFQYLLIGHKRAVKKLAAEAAVLLPNSHSEIKRFEKDYGIKNTYRVIYNGIDTEVFSQTKHLLKKNEALVICVARIEGKKNQLNLIKALNNTRFTLLIIGKPAPNHIGYYEGCKAIAAANIKFEGFVPQEELNKYYKEAKVHVLPSWNETCGLSSLEAAYYKCNIVITDKGDTREYYSDNAWYCDPDNPASILEAIELAASAPLSNTLYDNIKTTYNWKKAAMDTAQVYKEVLQKNM